MLRLGSHRRARAGAVPRAKGAVSYDIVIPTIGRPSLASLLARLDELGVSSDRIRVVDDVERRGPAAARNAGWRASETDWIVFLDDDVVPEADWLIRLRA